jgi:hypothetical protein
MIARVVFRIVEVKFEDCQSIKLYLNNTKHYSGNPQTLPQQYETLLWQSLNFTSTIRNTTLAILKLYLNNTEHYSGNHETLPQQYGTLLGQSSSFTSTSSVSYC